MPSHDSERNDDLIKARQRQEQQQSDPRADRGGDANHLLSALGNSGVQRLMRSVIHRQADGSGAVDEAVAKSIQAKRGSGQALDEGARRNLEPAFGEDFSDVRVHTDGEADTLNHAVQAEAFTTGKDIFFREGSYNPGSSDGQKLLAHELTHVVQQQSAPPTTELTVSEPEDASEREAGHVADSFSATAAPAAAVSRQPEEEELAMSRLDREEPEEEELAMSRLDREEPEEEELAMSRLDREEPEEEELAMSRLDREEPEEEELAMSRIDREEPEEEELAMARIDRQDVDEPEFAGT